MKTILLLTDLSAHDEVLATVALDLAIKSEAELLIFHTLISKRKYEENNRGEDLLRNNEAIKKLEKLVSDLNSLLESKYTMYTPFKIHYGLNSGERVNLSDCDPAEIWMVIMRLKNEGDMLGNFLHGTPASDVISQVKCPVLLVNRKTKFNIPFKIALATEFEQKDVDAIKFLVKFSTKVNSQIILVHYERENVVNLEESTLTVKPPKGQFPKLYYQLLESGMQKEIPILSGRESFDVIGFVCKKGNLVRQIYYSPITMALIKHPQASFFIFPE